jgi:NAD(P)-dependent dehydrogenase (short-subunit alcohol dehydrogenase family)
MKRSLHDRLVLITGASAGIGRAAMAAFLHEGARTVGVARSAEGLAALERDLDRPSHVTTIGADVADAESMQQMVARCLAACGLPDVIVANAGIGLDARFTETDDGLWQRLLDVNLLGAVRTIRPFLPAMISRGSGRVILVSSIVGKRGIPNYSAYSASKFALHGLADALRAELWGTGVSAGIVCPSSTATEFQEHAMRQGPPQRRKRVRRHPPESVATALVAMARSNRAEHLLSLEAKFLVWADALVPRLVDRFLARVLNAKE